MNRTVIIALFGAAGSGKDTIQKEIVKRSPYLFNEIISSTTRPPREYEKEGVDYHFINDMDARHYLEEGEYLEHAEFRGWTYGTLNSSVKKNKINIGVFNLSGVKQLLALPKDEYYILPIFIQCSDKERLLRQLNREVYPDCQEICRRFKTDAEDLAPKNMEFWHLILVNEHQEVSALVTESLAYIYDILLQEIICNNHGVYYFPTYPDEEGEFIVSPEGSQARH